MGVVGFEQTTYTFREDVGTVDVCVTFFQPDEIASNILVDLLGSTTDGSADSASKYKTHRMQMLKFMYLSVMNYQFLEMSANLSSYLVRLIPRLLPDAR